MALRPKYQLDGAAIQGARATIPAVPFTYLTTRRYPYPRTGTRAPDGMFPEQRIDGVWAPGLYTSEVGISPGTRQLRPKLVGGNPGLEPKYQSYAPAAHVRAPTIRSNPGIRAHYTLDKTSVQGVMPASTYQRITGKLTTEPGLPRLVAQDGTIEQYQPSLMIEPPQQRLVSAPIQTPALQWDWESFLWGGLSGVVGTLLFVYGVIPGLLEAAGKRVRVL